MPSHAVEGQSVARRGRRLRRYPALGFLVASAVLATLLPSSLLVPLSGPSASAELAPVPGRSDAGGDLSALGLSSSHGLGAGSGAGGAGADGGAGAPGQGDPTPGAGVPASNKRCVGDPPRQADDPLAPTCVSYFAGDNFGATSPGVTADEVRVVYHHSCNADGLVRVRELGQAAGSTSALVRYFNERYQTYLRRVRVFITEGDVDCSSGTAGKAAMRTIHERITPFYVFGHNETVGEELATEAARLGMMTSLPGASRAVAVEHAPFLVSYSPDLEDFADNVVESLCARLAGGKARFAGDPTLQDRRRKFGIVYNRAADSAGRGVRLIMDGVARRCPAEAGPMVVGSIGSANDSEGPAERLSRMRVEEVTTVVVASDGDSSPYLTAEASKWYPEWFVVDRIVGFNRTGRVIPATQWRSAFGLMGERRMGAPAEQHHRLAYAEGCPGCPVEGVEVGVYNELLLLFTGIQAAGPRLTPTNVDRGLRALPARQSTDPFTPSAYFGARNHSFVKDFALAWWDPAARAPGGSPPGCWTLVEDGLRYRAVDWAKRRGDHGIGEPGPCQGDI